MRVAEYSRDCLRELRARPALHYEHRTLGTLQLFRTPGAARCGAARRRGAEGMRRAVRAARSPTSWRVPNRHWRAVKHQLAGGLRLPNDETGDCHAVHAALADSARGLGVDFRFDTAVDGLVTEGGRIAGVRMAARRGAHGRPLRLAFGSYSRALLQPLGIEHAGLSGQGLFADGAARRRISRAAVSTVLDETYKVAVTRFDNRIRVGGMAELGGLRPAPESAAARDAGEGGRAICFPAAVPAARQLLDRPAADDARQHADRRRHAVRSTCSSTPATARWAGPWRADPAA